MVDGQLRTKDQIHDYIDRGNPLELWSYFDYVLETYDGKMLSETANRKGRTCSVHVPYREGSNRHGHCRIIRAAGHETMPYIPGQWFPARDRENGSSLFEASMLALLKPWRSLSDIKTGDETFLQAFDSFIEQASERVRRLICNIEFFHNCSTSARNSSTVNENNYNNPHDNDSRAEEDMSDEETQVETADFSDLISEEEIRSVIDQPFNAREKLYADVAIGIGSDCTVWSDLSTNVPCRRPPVFASEYELEQIPIWEAMLAADNEVDDVDPASNESVIALNEINMSSHTTDTEPSASQLPPLTSLSQNTRVDLNHRQSMAHTIISEHLREYLTQGDAPQRLMIVHGQGGTGKSTLLNAISTTFTECGASHLLAKTAMSGVAASVIGGQTLHTWAALPIRTPTSEKWITHPSKEIEKRRRKNMGTVLWLTIDEMSMLTTPLLLHLSKAAGVVRSSINTVDPTIPFGGLNIILLGDFHQFPPVANRTRELYCSDPPKGACELGRALFEQFDTVIKLDEQIRIQDETWNNILQRSRTGDCTQTDIAEIRKLVLTNRECHIPDFSLPPWNDTILVTPRNSVRCAWNNVMLAQHTRNSGDIKYVLYAHDSCKTHPLSSQERLAIAYLKVDQTNHLPNKVELVIGMKAMILANISTDSDLANGSRGIIENILLDPREEVQELSTRTIYLQYPPAAIIFRPFFSRNKQLPGFANGCVPILPTQKTFKLGGKTGSVIHRLQYPITPAYAFTDFKSQGQTIESVIVDLAKPPTGSLTSFNAYVALSRSRGRNTIRLLRDFDEKLFTTHPNEELRKEDDRLDMLETETINRFRAGEFRQSRT